MIQSNELVVDSFAGGGGASLGISWALGRGPDIAINHDAEAIALHAANHPESRHYCEDVWQVDPVEVCASRPVGLMWLSPDCKHFSKAKGGKPVSKKVRGLAWIAVRWATAVRPRVIVLENVEEFQTWGPVDRATQRPCPDRKGLTFRRFVARLERLGYAVEWRELRACDFGAPTIRKRLFLIARCDGQPIVWPEAMYGKGRPLAWRTAAECIDWSIPCPSIFERTKPLADATLRRIGRGLQRYVIEAAEPFIVTYYGAKSVGGDRVNSLEAPLPTQPTENRFGLVIPTLIQTGYGEDKKRNGGLGQAPRVPGFGEAAWYADGGRRQARARLVTTVVLREEGRDEPGTPIPKPISTLTTQDHHHLVTSQLVKLKGTSRDGQPVTDPLHTVQAGGNHYAEVRAFLVSYYGTNQNTGSLFDPAPTVTSKDRLGLVTIQGEEYAIADIGMRMLAPRELYRAQGFPDSYQIEIPYKGKTLSKTAQVRMCGNSVCPPMAEAIVRANLGAGAAEIAA